MKITKIETIWFDKLPDAEWRRMYPTSRQALPNNLWVRVYTDNGLVGLGETYYVPQAVSAIIHRVYSQLLLGRDALDIENHWQNMFALSNFGGFAGAEMRAISAVDVALWDILGQYLNQPIYNLLGGRNRDRIPVYNTCVGYGNYPDYQAWMEGRAGELAQDLLKQGIKALKFWPFDQFGPTLGGPTKLREPVTIWGEGTAAGNLGHGISNEDLKKGIEIVASVRRAVGDKMAIAIEGHARWDLPTAIRIARALEPYDVMWLEEIMPPDNPEAYVRLKSATTVPLCQSERLFTRFGFRTIVEKNVADIMMPDMAWGGGITEIRKICSMADTYYLPITLHDTIGPVALWSAVHMMLHIPNGTIQEIVRGYIYGWYNDVVTDQIPLDDGYLSLPERPGLGTKLRDDLFQRPGVQVVTTTLDDMKNV